jgi:leader peptidase (prepilin peptidase)/N-methyltransferase
LSSAVIGAAGGYVFLWLVYQIFKLVTGKEGMGYGDFKLFAALGAWLGWQNLPLIILLSSLVGAVVGITFILLFGRDRHLPIPFGPFLCVAGWVALLWGDTLTRYYLQFARITP